ncbi:MAG TPA: hypothetical protein VNG13_15230 [Mycobacteriales bacterium]|nr:hypothetical protein [Mycobacteriales bacterium]
MPADQARPLAVIDIDGVVADVRHRLHHLERRPKDWAGFFAAAPEDPPLAEGVVVVRDLAATHEIVYLTGRPARTRGDTRDWLARHHLPPGRIVMRADGDHRPARIAKVELLREVGADREVGVVIDDDAAVCTAVSAAGYPVRQADWAGRAPALEAAQEVEGRT